MNFNPRRVAVRLIALCVVSLGALGGQSVHAQASDNPGYDRPGLGFAPAALAAGAVTLEQGTPDFTRADGVTQYDADTLLRLGVGHALELQLGTGWERADARGHALDGRADSSLGLKFAPPTDRRFSWGLLGSVEFTDGAPELRSPRRQYTLGASFNWDHGDGRATGAYAEVTHGAVDGQLLAVNQSWALAPALSIYVEAAGQHVRATGSGSLAGFGFAWEVTPRIQLDASIRHRLGGHVDTWQGGLGVSAYFGN